MCERNWLEQLQKDQVNRNGLGMYVLDSFNEEAAKILAEHDTNLVNQTIDKFISILQSKIIIEDSSLKLLINEIIDQFKEDNLNDQ